MDTIKGWFKTKDDKKKYQRSLSSGKSSARKSRKSGSSITRKNILGFEQPADNKGLPIDYIPEVGYLIANRFKLIRKLNNCPKVQTWVAEDQYHDQSSWDLIIGKTINGDEITVQRKTHQDMDGNTYIKGHHHCIVKMENKFVWNPHVFKEGHILNYLKDVKNVPKPMMMDFDNYWNYIVFNNDGHNLSSVHKANGRKFGLEYVCVIAEYILKLVESIHKVNLVHGDIKPSNMLITTGDNAHNIMLIDFGQARLYWDESSNMHIKPRSEQNFRGTLRFASKYAHKGIGPSRRDDQYSIGYLLVYLINGTLPWKRSPTNSGAKGSNSNEMLYVGEQKMNTSLETLCLGLPHEISFYFQYIDTLDFSSEPDYLIMRKFFRSMYTRFNFPLLNGFEKLMRVIPKDHHEELLKKKKENEKGLMSWFQSDDNKKSENPLDTIENSDYDSKSTIEEDLEKDYIGACDQKCDHNNSFIEMMEKASKNDDKSWF